MANTHLLEVQRGVYARIAYHLPTQAGANSAGVAWKDVVIRSGMGGKTILPDGDGAGGTISATEKAQIASGDIYEMVVIEKAQPTGATNLNRLFNLHKAEYDAQLNSTYNKFGATN